MKIKNAITKEGISSTAIIAISGGMINKGIDIIIGSEHVAGNPTAGGAIVGFAVILLLFREGIKFGKKE